MAEKTDLMTEWIADALMDDMPMPPARVERMARRIRRCLRVRITDEMRVAATDVMARKAAHPEGVTADDLIREVLDSVGIRVVDDVPRLPTGSAHLNTGILPNAHRRAGCSFTTADAERMDGHLRATGHVHEGAYAATPDSAAPGVDERPMHFGDDNRTACGKWSGMVYQYTSDGRAVTCGECRNPGLCTCPLGPEDAHFPDCPMYDGTRCPTCGVTGGMPHDCETAGRIS